MKQILRFRERRHVHFGQLLFYDLKEVFSIIPFEPSVFFGWQHVHSGVLVDVENADCVFHVRVLWDVAPMRDKPGTRLGFSLGVNPDHCLLEYYWNPDFFLPHLFNVGSASPEHGAREHPDMHGSPD